MTRFRTALALLFAPLLLLAACSDSAGGGGAAATVNERDISDDDFRELLGMLADNPEFAQGLTGVAVHADGSTPEGRVDAAFAAAVLEFEILLDIVDAEFTDRGLEVTEEAREAARTQFSPELTAYLEALPEDYVESFETWNAQVQLLQADMASEIEVEEVTDEDVQAYYDENLATYENQVCASHVLVETEEEAQAVLDELNGGGDLATIAAEQSIDTGSGANGGDLGCASPDQYVEPFAAAVTDGAIGEYLGPVQTDFGYHVILVRSRGTTPFEDVEADIRAQLEGEAASAQGAAFGTWLQEVVSEAEVTVNSRYGTWNAEEGRVVPPEAPADGSAATVTF